MTVNLSMLAGAGAQFFTNSGVILSGGLVYTYAAGTTTPQAAYTTSSGSTAHTNPIVLDSAGRVPSGGEIWLTDAVAYKFVLQTSLAVLIATYDNITGNSSGIYATFAASSGSSLIGFIQAGANAVATTAQAKMRQSVSITDFGGAAGNIDNTAAMNAAAAYLSTLGGGTIVIPAALGSWKMNWVCVYDNIGISMLGGGARQADVNCIRPYSLTSAPVTFGDGVNVYYGNSLSGVSISGTDGTGVTAANCAPQCLLINGGVVLFTDDNTCDYYTGIQTVSLKSSATQPVTGARIYGAIRNDCTDSASARAIYGVSFAGNGYWTDNYFYSKVNIGSTAPDYCAEIDGTAQGITVNLGGYWDIKANKPILLKGAPVSINGLGVQLDPGVTTAIVLEINGAGTDITRIVSGQLRSFGGQQWKSTSGTFTVPGEADWVFYRPTMRQPYIRGPINIASSTDSYRDTYYLDQTSNTSPLLMFGNGFGVGTVGYGLVVKEGSNAKQGLSANMVSGAITIANTSVTANSRIFVSRDGTSAANAGALFVATQTAGVGFVVNSTNAADVVKVAYQIFEPAV